MKAHARILLAVAALLARLTGLEELLEAVALPLLFLEEGRRGSAAGKPAPQPSSGSAARASGR